MGRTAKQLRAQVLCAMYGRTRAGDESKLWQEPRGLKASQGLTAELTVKFINHSICAVNKFIEENRYISHMGPVGSWSQTDIDALVLPSAGDILAQEDDELDDEVAANDVMNDLINEVN